jgi:hypothetical protein
VSSTIERLRAARPQAPRVAPGMQRVLSLPVRREESIDLTDKYSKPGKTFHLRSIQSQALAEIEKMGGLVAPIGVGHGKFLISALAGTALNADRPLLLVPPALVAQTEKEIQKFQSLCKIPNNLQVLSYGKLSVAAGTALLESVRPDVIIADECHYLRHRTAARTKRVIRYFKNHPNAKFVGLSGTFTSKSLKDYAHLVELALRGHSPIPLQYWELELWASCVDVNGEPDDYAHQCFQPMISQYGGTARRAFYQRFKTAPGVIATTDSSASCSLYLRNVESDYIVPNIIRTSLRNLESTWTTPSGEEIEDALAMERYRQQILAGFYYEWEWPNGKVDWLWLDTRAEWHRQVRRVLKRSLEGKDSPLLVARWAQSEGCKDQALIDAWNEWDSVRHRPQPPVNTVWISEYLVDRCMGILSDRNRPPTIVWCHHKALLEAFERRGLTTYKAGSEIPDRPAHHCAMSMKAHGTGKNLQKWSENLLTYFPSNGSTLEQLIGRTHRPGQEADEVNVMYFKQHRNVNKQIEKALEISRYIQDTQGNRMKILSATWI